MEKLSEADRLRAGYQELGAKGLMTLAELGERLAGLNETRKTAQRELAALEGRRERLQELKRDRDTLLENYAGLVPEALDTLSAEDRQRIYRMLSLRALVNRNGSVEMTGVLSTGLDVWGAPMLELTHNHGRMEPYEIGDAYSHVAFTMDDLKGFVGGSRSKGSR